MKKYYNMTGFLFLPKPARSTKRKKLSTIERKQVLDKANGHCAYCGCMIALDSMQVDHVKSLYGENGADQIENMLPACRSCNHYKHTMTLEEFRERLERMPTVLRRDSVTYRIAERYGLVEQKKENVVFYFEQLGDE